MKVSFKFFIILIFSGYSDAGYAFPELPFCPAGGPPGWLNYFNYKRDQNILRHNAQYALPAYAPPAYYQPRYNYSYTPVYRGYDNRPNYYYSPANNYWQGGDPTWSTPKQNNQGNYD